MREVLLTALPWVGFLPADDVGTMADEFMAAASVGDVAAVSQLLIEWRHTAEIHADPDLYRALSSVPLGDFGAVPRPGE
jgi:hypothetical protein